LIIWVRADDRARATDITAYRALMEAGADPSRFLFVLTQADRIPPLRDGEPWQASPSSEQCLSLAVSAQVAGQLPSSFPVMAVSAHTGYNLPALVELIVHALPVQASSVYCQLKPEHQTPDTDAAVRQQFGEAAGKAFDTVINPDHCLLSGLPVKEYPTKVSATCHGIMGPNIWLKSAALPPITTFKNSILICKNDR
jgi:predicted GTPase